MPAQPNDSTDSTQQSVGDDTTWPVILQSVGGKLYIHHMKLSGHDTGTTAMRKLHRQYRRAKSQQPYHLWDRILVFWNPTIETATLSPNSSLDLEAQQNMRQVFVIRRKRDIELTVAFHSPDILSSSADFVKRNERFSMGGVNGLLGEQVLLVALEMNWIGLSALVILNLALCLGSGLVVGEVTGRVDLGVAVTSGAAGVLACIQAVLFLIYK